MRKLRWEVVDSGFPVTSSKLGIDLHSFWLLRLCKYVEWWQPTPVFLPGEFHGQWARQATVHGITKSRTQLWDFQGVVALTKTFHKQQSFFFFRYNTKMLLSVSLCSQSSGGSKSWKWLTKQSYGSRVACWGFPTRSPDSRIYGWVRYKAHPVLALNLFISLYWVPILVHSIAKSPSSNPGPFFTLASFLPPHAQSPPLSLFPELLSPPLWFHLLQLNKAFTCHGSVPFPGVPLIFPRGYSSLSIHRRYPESF